MAERLTLGATLAPYRALLGSRLASQRTYRASFAFDVFTSVLVGVVELAEVWVIFRTVDRLGGLDFHAVLLVFGIANFCFSLCQVAVGHIDRLTAYVVEGKVDAFYLRPLPLLAQFVVDDLQLRRLARVAVAVVAIVAALVVNDIAWSAAGVAMLAIALVFGTVLCGALFVIAGGLQFFLLNGAELTNAFTYGGGYAATLPAAAFPNPLRVAFGWILPVAFVGYLPTLVILDLAGPPLLPRWLAWLLPVAAAWTCALAGWAWRTGTRHYQGGGG
ncbi:MAG: ABC transporter permease [Desertimonas sp.]